MRVPGQVFQNQFRPAKRGLCEDHPPGSFGHAAQCCEGRWARKPRHLAVELKAACLERLLQINEEQVAEATARHLHGEGSLTESTVPATTSIQPGPLRWQPSSHK